MVSIVQLLDILSTTGLVADLSNYDPEKSFAENNIDSLDVMTILLQVEETLAVKFTEDEVGRIRTLADIATVLSNRC